MLTLPVKLVFPANLLFLAQNASLRRSTADFSICAHTHQAGCRGFARGLQSDAVPAQKRLPVRLIPAEFPKWSTKYSYCAKCSKPDQEAVSALQPALKIGGRGPRENGAQRHDQLHHCGRAVNREFRQRGL
jgi:hypothetical protein